MKIVTEEELREFDRVTITGGAKGLAYGLGTVLPASYLLHRRWPYYRALPLQLKAMGVLLITVPWAVIQAEKAGLQFDKDRYSKGLNEEVKKVDKTQLSPSERAVQFVSEKKYSIILGSWATSMVGAWAYISRDKLLTNSQKIVQVRMFAQGVTIAMILGSAVLGAKERKERKEHPPVDHSWMSHMNDHPEQSTVGKLTTS